MIATGIAVFSGSILSTAESHFPKKFSWNTLPVTWHGSVLDTWTDDELHALSKYAAVTLEKNAGKSHLSFGKHMTTCQQGSNATGCGCCEEDLIVSNFQRLKAVAPDVQTIAYTNSIIAYPWYRAVQDEFLQNESFWLRNANGELQHNIKQSDETWYTWDFSVPAVTEIYRNQCLSMVRTGAVDSCYADGCENVPTPLDEVTKEGYVTGKRGMLAELQDEIPGVVMCGSGGGIMDGTLAGTVQNWGKAGKYSIREIPMLQKAVAKGAMFSAKGHQVCNNGGDPYHPDIQTELAAFLVAAGEHSYFRCGSWSHSDIPWYPVYDMPLGAPLGNATFVDGVYSRLFSSGTNVSYDVTTETGVIQWASDDLTLV